MLFRSLEQKVGQMTQPDLPQVTTKDGIIDPSQISTYMLGSLLVGGSAVIGPNGEIHADPTNKEQFKLATMENWRSIAKKLMVPTTVKVGDKEMDIYPLIGTDAVHGNQHVLGEVLFPHNIGLAATHNEDVFFEAGYHNGASVKSSGWNYAFAPTVAISHNY